MINRRIRVVLALVLIATGCRSSPTTSLTAPTSPTTSAAATSSILSTSSIPSTSTTVAPTTTTISPLAAAEVLVRAAVDAFEGAALTCARTIPNCDVAMFDRVIRGPSLDPYKKGWADINSNGWAGRHLERRRYVLLKVQFPEPNAPELDRAVVSVCFADGSVTVKPGAAPDGSDVIVDEASSTRQQETEYRRGQDGQWRAYDFLKDIETLGGDTCPPA